MIQPAVPTFGSSEWAAFYQKLCGKYSKLVNTGSPSFLLNGEKTDLMALVIRSLTQPGDRVLIPENGPDARRLAGLVEKCGGAPVLFSCESHSALPIEALRSALKRNSAFKYALLVQSEHTTGVLNDLAALSACLKEFGILTLADCRGSVLCNPLDVRRARLDILCGDLQALGLPPHFQLLTISYDVFRQASGELLPLRDFARTKHFPYAWEANDLLPVDEALNAASSDSDLLSRHTRISAAVRAALIAGGLNLYSKDVGSGGRTVFRVPRPLSAPALLHGLTQAGAVIAPVEGELQEKVLCIPHIGSDCTDEKMLQTLSALTEVLPALGFSLKGDMLKSYHYHA